MDIVHIIVLALVQGLTEFLPISSSAHLILVPLFADWPDQGLAFDVALHLGSLIAVIIYFRKDLIVMTQSWFASLLGKGLNTEAKLAWMVLFGTIPVGLFGLLVKDYIEIIARSALVIAWATIIWGVLLGLADWLGSRRRETDHMRWYDVLVIGVAQAMALIPGTSRSGATITAALAMGLTRQAAARFSFLLSIPVIILAGGLKSLDLIREPHWIQWDELLLGTLFSAVSAYVCIHYFLKFIQSIGMWPFVIYRLVLGFGLLLFFT